MAFERAVELAPNPGTWHGIARTLTEKGVGLDSAERYVRMAIARVVKDLSSVGLDRVQIEHFQAMRFLPVYWDTLGWIAIKTGDFVRGEQWLRGAWLLGQDSETGERLGIVHEKLGKQQTAIEAYAQALALDSRRTSNRIALERLVGAGRVDVHLTNAQKAVVEQRTIKLPPLVSVSARADVNLIVDSAGRVTPT